MKINKDRFAKENNFPSKDWEEEFENIMNENTLVSGIDGEYFQKDIKRLRKFISNLLTQQQEEIIERLEKWDPMLKSPRLPNKDYSEGFRNGIDDAIRIIKEK